MTKNDFKTLIKEAVRDVIRTEFRAILREELKKNTSVITEQPHPRTVIKAPLKENLSGLNKYAEFLPNYGKTPQKPVYVPPVTNNPLNAFLEDTKRTMGGEEYRDIANMTSNQAQSFPDFTPGANSNMNMDLGEIEEYTPSSNIKMPNFPM